ncbi:hypothetical protein GUITHDRAFT_88345 [Guillardia theta CCMP2712]|uniref:Probable enoyl-CoA hydratase, mitochondrial n=1 Tax=Guillardia theta (strain CCMP2712) TaxID=905079 RepID=L1J0F8_GUITC|nr:hypothetical protein GUITHDRAFT_88345 [Guillardia theta CCMP2712]EKX41580.1 hypothetical protein GUITHDRAFT_88345 [Guillardia theta CCMP2712]|eukprot:XP_005828560.1 hypothetical protein GUITHDRAFT_88345 [Guillardia theta CCMP2712]
MLSLRRIAVTTRNLPFSTIQGIRSLTTKASYNNILVEKRGKVALLTLNRPKALNALNSELMNELQDAMSTLDTDSGVGAFVLTGSEKAFAAGADIKEMSSKTFVDTYKGNWLSNWGSISRLRKPIIAAVNGYALGGGCEVAMMCDIIYAGDNARFGQPEITIGTIPGGGGTQRLIRAIGKARAMEMILTGEQMTAEEALRSGLVAKVFPKEETVAKAIETAEKISSFSQNHVIMAKEAVNQAYEVGLQQGLLFELRSFWTTFATEDQKEGMAAFIEKRKPNFRDQ